MAWSFLKVHEWILLPGQMIKTTAHCAFKFLYGYLYANKHATSCFVFKNDIKNDVVLCEPFCPFLVSFLVLVTEVCLCR